MAQYRKKGVVEAVEYTGSFDALPDWAKKADKGDASYIDGTKGLRYFDTGQGLQVARPGDWIVESPTGAVYPCPAADFALSYEPAESG